MLEQMQGALNGMRHLWEVEIFLMFFLAVPLMGIGVGRIRSSYGRKWIAIILCVFSYLICMGMALSHSWMSKEVSMTALKISDFPELGQICQDWGSNLTKKKRTQYSEMLARQVFWHTGGFRNYFDLQGNLVEFKPSDSDRQYRANLLNSLEQMQRLGGKLNWIAIIWAVLPLLGVAIGFSFVRFYKRAE